MRRQQRSHDAIAGFEEVRGPLVKECRQPLEAGKAKETDCSLEGMQSCQHFDFSLVRSILDL